MDILSISTELGKLLRENFMTISCAESCTGGLIASTITDVAGSSEYFELGLVTYKEEQKVEQLGVDSAAIDVYTAVSEVVCQEMLEGLYEKTKSNVCITTTGYAGPSGGTKKDPVGTVYIGIKINDRQKIIRQNFKGSRTKIKQQATKLALKETLEYLKY